MQDDVEDVAQRVFLYTRSRFPYPFSGVAIPGLLLFLPGHSPIRVT